MKKVFIIFLISLCAANAQELKVVDGDTIHLNGKKIRFSGIDTPELKQKCTKNGVIVLCGIEIRVYHSDQHVFQKCDKTVMNICSCSIE